MKSPLLKPSLFLIVHFFFFGNGHFVACQQRKSFPVHTSEELQRQLNRISPGESIILHEGVYKRDFTSSRSGNSSSLVLLMPYLDAKAKILGTGKDGVAALSIYGDYWSVESIMVGNRNGFGVLFKGKMNNANKLQISDVDTGILLQGDSNSAFTCSISQARVGIHLKGDSSSVMYNNIFGASPSILGEENTCCGIVRGNDCDGEVDVRGTEYSVEKKKIKFNLVGGTHSIKGDMRVLTSS